MPPGPPEGANMARMHSRKKGKSSSSRPIHVKTPEWVTAQPDEVKEMVLELGREGTSTSQIGIKLRDVHGVPSVKLITGMKIGAILEEGGLTRKLPEDLENLIKKVNRLYAHLQFNPKDLHNRRGLELTEAKIRRMARYYIGAKRLPTDWKYRRADARLMVE